MDFLRFLFPFSFKTDTTSNFVVSLVLYVLVGGVCGIIFGVLSHIILVGWIFSIIGSLIGLYTTVGIVLAILSFLKVI